MQTRLGDFDLTMDELRAIAEYAVACAEPALFLFQKARPEYPRPAAALHAAERPTVVGRRILCGHPLTGVG